MDWYGCARSYAPLLIKRPLGYYFYITGRCNLSCDYCWQREEAGRKSESTKTRKHELSTEEWVKIVKSVPKFSFIGLTGGEPLLHPGFNQIVQNISLLNPFTVNTNGILLTDEIIENLIDCKVSNVSISIDGFSDVHDVSRKKVGLFNTIVERIKRLNELKEKKRVKRSSLTIKTVLLDPLVEKLDEFYRFCDEKLKADCLNISIMKTTQHVQFDFRVYEELSDVVSVGEPSCDKYDQIETIPEVLSKLLEDSQKRRCKVQLYPRMYNSSSIDYLFQKKGKNIFEPCYLPWNMNVILADGSIIPCLSIKIGNIRHQDYDVKQISRLKKYQEFLGWRLTMNRAKNSPSVCNMCCFSIVQRKP
ncbi:MAG: radical SAM protein [Thermodesulfobacteriota bacterium]